MFLFYLNREQCSFSSWRQNCKFLGYNGISVAAGCMRKYFVISTICGGNAFIHLCNHPSIYNTLHHAWMPWFSQRWLILFEAWWVLFSATKIYLMLFSNPLLFSGFCFYLFFIFFNLMFVYPAVLLCFKCFYYCFVVLWLLFFFCYPFKLLYHSLFIRTPTRTFATRTTSKS